MLERTSRAVAIAAAGVLAMAGPALAHGSDDGAIDNAKATHGHDQHEQHGGKEGHLPPLQEGVELVSKLELSGVSEGRVADVAVSGNYAYLAAWGGTGDCAGTGFWVVDISTASAPKEVAFVPTPTGSYPGEGMHVTQISTPSFTGEVLVTNNEVCGADGVGGMNIYDVRNPTAPVALAVGVGDKTTGDQRVPVAHTIHSVFAWDAGRSAYAVMVDNEEAADVDIMDITDPRRPKLIAEHDLAALSPQILQPGAGLDEVFLHDMVVEEIGGRFVMLASYWDAGYVQLDVTDPRRPQYLSDSDVAAQDPEAAESGLTVAPEGNAHQAEFTSDNAFFIGADEDFAPYALRADNTTDRTEIDASQGSGTPSLPEGETITGQSKYVGRACDDDPAVPAGDGRQIAVVERGVCTFTEKVANVEAAGGYAAILIFNREGSDGCNASLGMSVEGGIPTFGVAPREQGLAIFGAAFDERACLAGNGSRLAPIAVGTLGDQLAFSSYFDGWGYVHLYANGGGKVRELDTYAVDEAHDPKFATGSGDLSVHEVATSAQDAGRAYLSYYAAGLRVIDIQNDEIVEVGAFIDKGGNNFWGVEVFQRGTQEYVALSDRDFGLYILKVAP